MIISSFMPSAASTSAGHDTGTSFAGGAVDDYRIAVLIQQDIEDLPVFFGILVY